MQKMLIIQTAFIGDVILATALAEKLHHSFPDATIDFLVRRGSESLFHHHPFINKVWVWDKKNNKQRNLFNLGMNIRRALYTHVINPHRFASSGFISYASGAAYRSGFNKNPLSYFYTYRVNYVLSSPYSPHPVHEIQRNQMLISPLTDAAPDKPKLYPSATDYEQVNLYQNKPYICIAPSSVWFTKQFPATKWVALIHKLKDDYTIYLLGGKGVEQEHAELIKQTAQSDCVINLSGKLSLLQSAALMQGAQMNYVNDSAPLHMCSAMQAPVMAVFCSTVPAFGFTPTNANGQVVEIQERIACRPCGLHGRRSCPEGHFQCAEKITNHQLLSWK